MDFFPEQRKKKKVDGEALSSPFNRIPRIGVIGARALLDLGFRDIFELEGRSPEHLYDELKRKRGGTLERDFLARFRLAVYFAENPNPEGRLLRLEAWVD
jgi:hypothetical protein